MSTGRHLIEEGVYVSAHARERLQEHLPNIGVRGALQILADAEELDPLLAAAFTGRSARGVGDRYFLTASHTGILVVARARHAEGLPWCMVTYLRFGAYQQQVADELYARAA